MGQSGKMMAFLLLMAGSTGGAAPQSAPAPTFDLPAIQKRLASDDYAVRHGAQVELDKIPADQIDTLRAASRQEKDPEAKAALDRRIDAMELYKFLHPPALTVDVKDADMRLIANLLNQQLGSTTVQTISSAPGPGSGFSTAAAMPDAPVFTLAAHDQPFWEIVRQMNLQHPIAISTATSITGTGLNPILRLGTATTAQANAALDNNLKVFDTFAFRLSITGTPATGSWSIRINGFSDPRVKISQYSGLHINKLTDQDGRSLVQQVTRNDAMTSTSLPTSGFTSTATVAQVPGLTQIKELQGSVRLMLLVSQKSVERSLLKEPIEPIDTLFGKLSISINVAGRLQLSLPGAEGVNAGVAASAPTTPLLIQFLNDQGTAISTSTAILRPGSSTTLLLNGAAAPASAVRITVTDKTREMTLPVQWADIVIDQVRPVTTPGGGGRGAIP